MRDRWFLIIGIASNVQVVHGQTSEREMDFVIRRPTGVSFATSGTLVRIGCEANGLPTGTSSQVESERSPQPLGSP
jgi:hypothetical protein